MAEPKWTRSEIIKARKRYKATRGDTDSFIIDFLSSLDTPRSLTVAMLFKYNEHDQLTSLAMPNPDWYDKPYQFRDDYVATEFLSKAEFLNTTFNRKERALTKFHESEAQCALTNRRFRNLSGSQNFIGINASLLHAMAQLIGQVLGPFSPEEIVDGGGWGPGVSTLIKGEHVSATNKFRDERGVTRNLAPICADIFPSAYPLWTDHLLQTFGEDWLKPEVGNVIVTVPKNSKTDRVIAIEPGINLWFQKAIGSAIRKRLRRYGVNLNSQDYNQQLAKEGSLSGSLATIDFSSASDLISLEVVRFLMPHDWFRFMELVRCDVGLLDVTSADGSTVRRPVVWEKFSSMGNGFTFELESLIFWAAAKAVQTLSGSSGTISVFGDDVILPSCDTLQYTSLVEFMGFTVNLRKSFSSGRFRESCGSHFFQGIDCKPIYLKQRLYNAESVFKLANSVRGLAHRYGSYRSCDSRLEHCWRRVIRRLPNPLRIGISASVGSTAGIHLNFDECSPSMKRPTYLAAKTSGNGAGWEGYEALAFVAQSVLADYSDMSLGTLLARLWVGSDREHGNTYALRGRTTTKLQLVVVPQWYNFGPWC